MLGRWRGLFWIVVLLGGTAALLFLPALVNSPEWRPETWSITCYDGGITVHDGLSSGRPVRLGSVWQWTDLAGYRLETDARCVIETESQP